MFYKDDRHNEIIIVLPIELSIYHQLNLAELEIFSIIKKYTERATSEFAIGNRKLLRAIDIDDNTCLKSIIHLEKLGLIMSKKLGNEKYWTIKKAAEAAD